ncbi:MAG: magnesium chelatase [Planctomycetota bacterium]|nr:MAG: magnesium chelatase [Planctomycetota bacterium]
MATERAAKSPSPFAPVPAGGGEREARGAAFDPGRAIAQVRQNIERVFVGKPELVEHLLVALLAGGHVLIEDVPGVGKTTLAKALARSLDASFRRLQFTPDLLPSDITGVAIYDQKRGVFEFKPGPIFANVVLADEINRTNPRTQSALLEAMSDRQVSVDGVSYELPQPFIVLATQNPHEYEGTYPLPESQLDRFFMRLEVGYPTLEEEREVLRSRRRSDPLEQLAPVLACEDVLALQRAVLEVRVDDAITDYVLALVHATRASPRLEVGVSPRGSLALRRAAQALALLLGRDYVVPDDVKRLAVPVMAHRVLVRGHHGAGSAEGAEAVRAIVEAIEVPL